MDYNTRWSGITAESYAQENKISLSCLQEELCKFMHSETILIGHSLDSDLKSLRVRQWAQIGL